MSEIANSEGGSETEKPVQNDVKFPPFPDPKSEDFDEDISDDERNYYKEKFKDLNTVKSYRLHCTACDRHMGCSARNERMRSHPMLRTLVCHSCHTFYNSGEFEKGDDGSELYCRWCGQGGQVYCCSDCPHVFCAKCIRRNFGTSKIREIENADDWKCFKCNSSCLKDLRAICWAVLRYCDLKNKVTYQTQDPDLKAAYQKDCALDLSECCKHKTSKRNQKLNESLSKKKEIKKEAKETKEAKESEAKTAANIISKMPPTIQVKKFASVSATEEACKPPTEKKAQKRSASPKTKSFLVKNPITIAPCTKVINPVCVPPLAKKIRLPNCTPINTPIRFPTVQDRKNVNTYTRIRPKLPSQLSMPMGNNCFNGFATNVFQCGNPISDNINLSLESLTQGLDMAAVAAISNNANNNTNNPLDDDVVCTPDFPLEPLCEVTEDNDDDVQCITPGPVAVPKLTNPPPLVPRATTNVSDVTPENIIQMTDNDVTVNESTGGLKFRVDPQTLSSNKMYRLPDGRIFAINANPNMPGGYSATIVAVTEANKSVPKGATFAAKLNSVSTSTPTPKNNRNQVTRFVNVKRATPKPPRNTKTSETSTRECDLNVPVEWYRYNLIDAVDALEYSLSRLHKLKKEATSVYLRTRSVAEMRSLHRTLERLLNTSSTRFKEIRENLNKGLKQYIMKKAGGNTSDDDDDVEILPDIDEDPIFIDENSIESNMNGSENQEVDLTGHGSSEYNDSGENRNDHFNKSDMMDPLHDNDDHATILNIRSLKDCLLDNTSENKKDDENKVNGIESTQKDDTVHISSNDDLKCDETFDEINKDEADEINKEETVVSPNTCDTKSKEHEEENEMSEVNVNEKADSHDSDDKIKKSDEKTDEPRSSRSENKSNDSRDKTNDSQDKTNDSEEKSNNIDKNTSESDDKKLNTKPEDKLDDKTQESDKQDLSGGKAKELDDKMQDVDEKMDDLDDKTQDADDKMQDSEMSEELIETLLKDENSQDNIKTNSDVPEALQVT